MNQRMNQGVTIGAVAAVVAAVLAAGTANAGVHIRPVVRPHGHVHFAFFPPGMYVGAGLMATRIVAQSGGDELIGDGAGISLFSGIRVNKSLALELGWMTTLHNPEQVSTAFGNDVDYLSLNGLTADARVFIENQGSSVQPYVQGGVGLYLLDRTYFGTEAVGSGFQLGGGFTAPIGDSVDLGLRGLYRGISMGPPNSGMNDTFISAVSIEGHLQVQF